MTLPCTSLDWTAIGSVSAAVGAVSATVTALLALWYTHRSAQDQLEAQVAPILMLKSGRAVSQEGHRSAGRLDRAWGKPSTDIHVSNEGTGVALNGILIIRAGHGDRAPCEYTLSAIPAGKFITLVVAREDFFGDEHAISADRSFRVRFVAEYRSLGGRRYRTRLDVRGWDQHGESEDQSNQVYERCDEAKRNASKRFREITRRGHDMCRICGEEIGKPYVPRRFTLNRRAAKTLSQARDTERVLRWKLGLKRTATITVCDDCETRMQAIMNAVGGQS